MHLKRTSKTVNDTTYHSYKLVQSVRTPDGPRQKVLINLGNLDTVPRDKWTMIAQLIQRELSGQLQLERLGEIGLDPEVSRVVHNAVNSGLLDLKKDIEQSNQCTQNDDEENDDEWFTVSAKSVQMGNACEAGAVHVGHQMWKKLSMDDCLKDAGLCQNARTLTEIAVINCLVEPGADSAIPAWITRTALPDILSCELPPVNNTALYRNLDKLHPERNSIEKAIAAKENSLFNMDNSIYMYDLTSTYFEGLCSKNDKARHGYSRDKRSDAKQVVVGLVMNKSGFTTAHEIFEGNRNDTTTVEEMLERLDSRTGGQDELTVVVDRGMASKENLDTIKNFKNRNYHYLVAAKQPERNQCLAEFEDEDSWIELHREVSPTNRYQKKTPVKIKRLEKDNEVLILCLSEGRAAKDKAIREKHENRLLKDLDKLSKRISSGKFTSDERIFEHIGRLKERHSRVARYHDIVFDTKDRVLTVQENKELKERATRLDGSYLLKTDRKDLSEQEIWHVYSMLTRVEDAFRDLKGPLAMRPIFHHLSERVETHIFICVLALHLLNCIERLLVDAGIHSSWATVRKILRTHQVATVSMKTITGHYLLVRQATAPEPAHREIYKALNIPSKVMEPIRILCPCDPTPAFQES